MCERVDLELRVYLTGRPGGQLEWQVTVVEEDGQVRWSDGGVSPWRPQTAVLPSLLGRVVSMELRHLAYKGRRLA